MTRRKGDVEKALDRELAEVRKRAPDLADSTLAALARSMARELDDEGNSATSKSMCAGKLAETLERLRELTPPKTKGDTVDDITRKRAERLARRSAGASMPRS